MNKERLYILIAMAAVIGAIYSISSIDEKRAGVRDKLEATYATLLKEEAFIARTHEAGIDLKDAMKELEKNEKNVIVEEDESLAFARVQARIQDLAQAAGLRITSLKLLPPADASGYKSLPIFMNMAGRIDGLSEFLHQIDSSEEMLGIERLSVTASQQGDLRIRIQVAGLMKK